MNTPPATPSPTRHHGRTPIVRRKEYNHSITLPTQDLLVQVTVRAPRHPAKRSPRKNWFRKQVKKFQLKNRSRTKTKGQKDELRAVRAELQNIKDEMDKLSSLYNKYTARVRGLELQNEILKQEVELDEASDGFQDIVELGRQDRQFTSDNDTHGIHIHDDDDEKVGPSTWLVTPSPPPPPQIPKTPCHPWFTNKCSSGGAASIPTTPDSPNDGLNTGLPSGMGMREVEREKKGAEPAKSSIMGLRKEEGNLELGTTSRRLANKWMGTLDSFWNPFSLSRS
jgi:hypothetical protein